MVTFLPSFPSLDLLPPAALTFALPSLLLVAMAQGLGGSVDAQAV